MRQPTIVAAAASFFLILLFGTGESVFSTEPPEKVRGVPVLAQFIDTQIDQRLQSEKVPASPLADDAEFLRRIYLDLTGHIPPLEKTVAFLDSKDTQKRTSLIEELLASPDYGTHFAIHWANLLLTGETPAKDRKTFETWLASQMNKETGWDSLVRDMLTAEGDPAKVPQAVFVMAQSENNQVQPNLLAAATTRYFLGVQLQCAECHNHPFTTWKQTDFWGVAAFYSKTKYQKATKTSPVSGILEMEPLADPKKKSKEPAGAAIAIPGTAGKAAGNIIKAKFLDADEPDLGSKTPFRPSLADWITARDNPYFARAAVNRMWAHLFGRGLVHPVDDMHADNPGYHAELLDALAAEFTASGYDFKHLLRCITTSQTYQRTSRPLPDNADDQVLFSHMATRVMSPEAMYNALTRALGVKDLTITGGTLPTPGIGGAKKNAPTTPRDKFVRFFNTQDADSVSTDFTHGIPQALALMNDPQFNKGGPVVEQLLKENLPPAKAIDRLFLSTLSRPPSTEESRIFAAYLDRQPNAAAGYSGALWILLNTQEFVLIR
jgi:hypothetical protein